MVAEYRAFLNDKSTTYYGRSLHLSVVRLLTGTYSKVLNEKTAEYFVAPRGVEGNP